ncbi:hypothetical protein EC957_010740 [Mortierella hygrophila]|uniref:Uncharacterized protein n=1 Tax=Mortierella hygrophila TaxID=979708 RepID=A0A9P6FH90_9FUNG|nr:hypothetical protein EC957_010740 [Mortierella hygrophila]
MVFISRKVVKLTADVFATNLLLDGSESICAICKKPCECINIPENVFQEQNFTKLINHQQARTKRQNEVLMKARTELLNMKAMKR